MPTPRRPYELYPATVKRSDLVAPHLKRITVDTSGLPALRTDLPAQWFKVFVSNRSVGRAYTVRRVNLSEQEVDIDIFLHGPTGPVSAWAETVNTGDTLELSDVHPRSGYPIYPIYRRFVLIGDEAALPAIGAIIDALPGDVSAHVVATVQNEHERIELTCKAALTSEWLYRDVGRMSPDEALLDRVVVPGEITAYWIAGESSEVKGIRMSLLKRGVPKEDIEAAGYWKRGEADHRDSD